MNNRILLIFTSSLLLCCYSFGQSGGETCATATVIPSLPYVGVGNTSGAVDDYFASCNDYPNSGGARDQVYTYTNGANGIYIDVTLCTAITNYDSQLYVYENTCTGTPIACQEDGCQSPAYGAPYNSTITAVYLQPNLDYFFVVDGFDAGANGDYQINIAESVGLNPPDSTNLPLFLINTNGQTIVDEPKIPVELKIIHNGPGQMNHPTDPANEFDGFAGIEIRGAYSATLPQKPYGFETWDVNANDNNVSLLNMPEENDWILLANYNDKVFMRNTLSFHLFRQMGYYAPRTEFCEVVIDDIYQGIYVFTEKIKRDQNRVNISRLDLDDNYGDSLTGGYIFKVDYWNSSNSWPANYDNPLYPGDPVQFVYDYPDENTITAQQKDYLQNRVKDFEDALWGPNFTDPVNGYRPYINVYSFIDYFIVNEFARNVDGFKKSRRFHKDRWSEDNRIEAGPVWDFDWAYKDVTASETNGAGWRHNWAGGSDVKPPGWYIRMLQDPGFADDLACRYWTFRQSILDTAYLFNYVDSIGNMVMDAQQRHYVRWPILGINVGTPEVGPQPTTYAGELAKFKTWIADRITWLDANMPGNCPNLGIDDELAKEPYLAIYPNPSSVETNVYVDEPIEEILIYDISGKLVRTIDANGNSLVNIDTGSLSGVFMLKIRLESDKVLQSRIITQ